MRRLLLGIVLFACSCSIFAPPDRVIRPVLVASVGAEASAMRSAPIILVAEISEVAAVSARRMVDKPPGTAGPQAPQIPLMLAKIKARVLITLRGPERKDVEFYCWVWAGSMHGGPRLFHPNPGSGHVLFLRQEGRYLHTVGDYPSYELELNDRVMPYIESTWRSTPDRTGDLFQRLVAARLHAEFDNLTAGDLNPTLREPHWIPTQYAVRDKYDLEPLVGPLFLASQLDAICRTGTNRLGRIAACAEVGEFLGRCQAFRIALGISPDSTTSAMLKRTLENCEATEESTLRETLATFRDPHRRDSQDLDWIRTNAAAPDPQVHKAYCELAATLPEARNIPECADFKH